ncbi:MAG: hypothetical protein CVU18_16920 [Betaproteobacteria bacterium HGW-Betaproteobacteria-12]|nr:MAG: hypothetical protein CVU18_16920 [Betaproteobacteria bacterium HGW-Betaproteobacteria-12]
MIFKRMLLPGLLATLAIHAHAQVAPSESCAQIRERIQAQSGLLPKPDTELLKAIGDRSDCRFTTPEVWRAAFGDRPTLSDEPAPHRRRQHDEDDDD